MRRSDGLLDGAARALSTRLASGMTRRSFLGRMGGAVLAATGGAAVAAAVRPMDSGSSRASTECRLSPPSVAFLLRHDA